MSEEFSSYAPSVSKQVIGAEPVCVLPTTMNGQSCDSEVDEANGGDGTQEGDNEDDAPPAESTGGKHSFKRGGLIHAGSVGNVYLGLDSINGQPMAVKQVEVPRASAGPDPNERRKKSALEALSREADLLRELQHDHIVQYLGFSLDETHFSVFFEYISGGSVAALLRNYGTFEEALCRNFVRQILQGLNYLHEREIVHGDIKGANILVDNRGNVKISGFGMAKKIEEIVGGGDTHNQPEPSLHDSAYWTAPEVVKKLADTPKADIWSVGCLVVEMLTADHPFPTQNQMQAILIIGSFTKPTVPDDISSEAKDFLEKTFEIDYDKRPGADALLRHAWIAKDT